MEDTVFDQFLQDTDIKVSLNMFKGKYRVDVRKYWDDKGEMKPSPKGISMTLEQFDLLCEIIPSIKEKISQIK